MKKLLVSISLVLLSVCVMAQTKTGLQIIPTLSTVDVRVSPAKMKLGGELGYFGNVLGIAATLESDTKFTKRTALVGLKGYANVAKVENMVVKAAFGVSGLGKDLRKFEDTRWRFSPELSLSVPLFSHLDFRFAAQGHLYNKDNWNVNPGASFGLVARL